MSTGLYEHQRKAVEKMRSGSVLCGGVGSGKSRTALAFFVTKICNGKIPSPKSSDVASVKDEIPLYIITTARKRDTLEWEYECANFYLSTNGPSLVPVQIDSWNKIDSYLNVEGAFFIFDEQRIVGTGKWAKSFVKIAKKNQWVLLSATPGDTWMDYWAVFVANGYYKNLTDFRRQHVIYRRMVKFPQIERYVDTAKLERLRRDTLISMSFDRKTVRHHEYVKVGYDEDTYDLVYKKRWNVYENKPLENISETCYVLRKVVNSDSRRCEAVRNLLRKRPTAIIFYNYNYELNALRCLLDAMDIVYTEWNGQKHEELPEGSRWVYLVQYTAGCEGWNCVTTDTIIFYSQNYSYKVFEQSCGRIDRLNTPYTDLYYYHIFSDANIDKAIRRCLKRKESFNEKAFLGI